MLHSNSNNNSSTIRSLKRRRRRRPAAAKPLLLAGMACITVMVLWSVGALFFATYSRYYSSNNRVVTTTSLLRLHDGSAFPSEFFDVWPDSSNLSDGMDKLMESCYPADDPDPDKCRIITSRSKNKKRRIAILRLPGKLGRLMETYLQELLATWNDTDTEDGSNNEAEDIQLVPTSDVSIVNQHEQQQQHHHQQQKQQRNDYKQEDKHEEPPIAQIIRPVVLPPLLEALDLILQTQNVDETTIASDTKDKTSPPPPPALPTVGELQAVLQQVMRWHCRVAQQTEHRARMTILLDEITIYPKVIGEDVGNFLNLSFDKDKNVVNDMNDLAVRLIQRLGQTWRLARDIWESSDDTTPFTMQLSKEEWVNRIVNNELLLQKDQSCLSPSDVYPKTRVTELIGTFLSGEDTASVCQSYAESILCHEQS